MDFKTGFARTLVVAAAVMALAACGKKEPAPVVPADAPAADQPANTNLKKTEKFGLQSSILLEPVFEVPARYRGYVRQEVTEASTEEFQKLPDTMFESYVATWLKQAASVDAPDWAMLSTILHPELAEQTNAFKKQEAADHAKTELPADKASLDMVYGWQGEIVTIAGPDVATGEYYLTINPDGRSNSVSYTPAARRYNYQLRYAPRFKAVGMEIDCQGSRSCRGDINMTVKVPVEKARAIEASREKGKDMVRLYGHVTGKTANSDHLSKDNADASLDLQVEALEVGSRQGGQFVPYFFLDKDQLTRWKP